MTKKPHSDTRIESHQSGRKSCSGSASASVTDSNKKRSHGYGIYGGLKSATSLTSYSSVVQVGTLL